VPDELRSPHYGVYATMFMGVSALGALMGGVWPSESARRTRLRDSNGLPARKPLSMFFAWAMRVEQVPGSTEPQADWAIKPIRFHKTFRCGFIHVRKNVVHDGTQRREQADGSVAAASAGRRNAWQRSRQNLACAVATPLPCGRIQVLHFEF